MICNVVGVLVFVSVFGIISSDARRAIDCRKHVFAPICRGISKRGFETGPFDPELLTRYNSFVRNPYPGRQITENNGELESTNDFEGRGGDREKSRTPFNFLHMRDGYEEYK